MANLKLVEKPSLYDTDFYAWISEQATLLKQRKLTIVDYENLIEEILSMGKSERRALVSAYTVLIIHLLKWQFQPHFRGSSWEITIITQRQNITVQERESPSLRAKAKEHILEGYDDARKLAARETRLPLKTFPETCPYTLENLRDFDWMPA